MSRFKCISTVPCVIVSQGMVEAADYISNKIKDEGLLARAFNSEPVLLYLPYITSQV